MPFTILDDRNIYVEQLSCIIKMAASIHAINRVKAMLQQGPLTKDEIVNRINLGRNNPTPMELVGILKPYNGIRKTNEGKYELI